MEINELILKRFEFLQSKSLKPVEEVVVSKTEWDALEAELRGRRVYSTGVELPTTNLTWEAFKAAVDLKHKNMNGPLKSIEFMGPYGPVIVKRATGLQILDTYDFSFIVDNCDPVSDLYDLALKEATTSVGHILQEESILCNELRVTITKVEPYGSNQACVSARANYYKGIV